MIKEKKLLLEEIKDNVVGAKGFILLKYKKLDSNNAANFRFDLLKSNSRLVMVKKRMFVKAMDETGVKIEKNLLEGHIAIVVMNDDIVEGTKVVYKFKDSNEGVLEVVSGMVDGDLCSGKDVDIIAKLPAKQELKAQFLATLEAPMSETLAVMDSLLTSILYCLENKNKQN